MILTSSYKLPEFIWTSRVKHKLINFIWTPLIPINVY